MPRINYLRTKGTRIAEASRGCADIGRIVKGYANAPKIGQSDMVSMSESVARRRLAQPETLTLEELIQICIAFDIPRDDVLAKLYW